MRLMIFVGRIGGLHGLTGVGAHEMINDCWISGGNRSASVKARHFRPSA